MQKYREKEVRLLTAAQIALEDSPANVSKLFIDTDNNYIYYVADDGTATLCTTSGTGANLSIGTITGTTVDVNSDTGTNATIPAATGSTAGLLTATKHGEITANTAKVSADGSVATHSDVTISGISLNDFMKWNGSALEPVEMLAAEVKDFASAVSWNASVTANTAKVSADGSIATHSNVDLSGLTTGQYLKYNGSNFVPDSLTAADVSDFDTEVSNNTSVSANTSHRVNTSNPHNTDIGNLGSGTLAELNSKVTDATLDTSTASRPPTTVDDVITHFQVFDDGSTGQATTTSAVVLAGMWTTPDFTTSDISWNGTNGRATFNTSGIAVIDAKAVTHQTAGARHELHLRVLHWNGSSLNIIDETPNYASRDATQDEGFASISGLKINVASTDYVVMAVYHVGAIGTVGNANVAGQTRLSITLFK